jgi:hypothetical protein
MKENLGLKEISAEQAAMVERIYREWDRAWSNDDLEGMLAVYAADAVLESLSLSSYVSTGRRRGTGRVFQICSAIPPFKCLACKPSARRESAFRLQDLLE